MAIKSRKYKKRNNKPIRIRGGNDVTKCTDTMCNNKKFEEFHNKTKRVFERDLKMVEMKLKGKITKEEKKELEEEIKIQKENITPFYISNANYTIKLKQTILK